MHSGVTPTVREREFARGHEGVTLVELMVVMAIIGILVLVGFNTMSSVIPKHRVSTAAEDVLTKLRMAQMLALSRNRPVTVVFDVPGGVYNACFNGNAAADNDCADAAPTDEWLNLDSGRTSTLALATKDIPPLVTMYDADFGTAGGAITYLPPSGLVKGITDGGGAFVNGAVCFSAVLTDEDVDDPGYAFDPDDFEYRRISVNPITGKATLWRAKKGLAAEPVCDNLDADWDKVY